MADLTLQQGPVTMDMVRDLLADVNHWQEPVIIYRDLLDGVTLQQGPVTLDRAQSLHPQRDRAGACEPGRAQGLHPRGLLAFITLQQEPVTLGRDLLADVTLQQRPLNLEGLKVFTLERNRDLLAYITLKQGPVTRDRASKSPPHEGKGHPG